jgi:hypothetical protein
MNWYNKESLLMFFNNLVGICRHNNPHPIRLKQKRTLPLINRSRGHQGNALPIIQSDRTFLLLGQGPAATQQAGLGGMGRVP